MDSTRSSLARDRFDRPDRGEPLDAEERTRDVLAFALPSGSVGSPPVWRRNHAHLSDEALVALVARSDESALAELYDRVGGTAYGLAYRVLRDEALAEDAVQEAFLGLWRGAGSFVPERAKASTWILTLVHRRAVDLVRREQRRRTETLETAPEPRVGSSEEAAWLRLDRERVLAALAQLPDQEREAIELAYYGGYTQSELAARLGQPLGTIKSRMFAGLSRLRELLDEGTEKTWTFTS
jgi:RNA polymerase sigma-70 factor (ECF subfamily)